MSIVAGHSRIVRLAVEATMFEQQCVNVFHYEQDAMPMTSVELLAAASGFQSGCLSTWQAMLSNQYVFRKITARYLIPDTPIVEIELTGVAGNHIQIAAAPQLAGIVKWSTGYGGRQRRGRSYFAGWRGDQIVSGKLDATALANLQAHAGNLMSFTGGGINFALVVYSKTAPEDYAHVISHSARAVVGVQRRRRIGSGS